jgi:hypothetical protein
MARALLLAAVVVPTLVACGSSPYPLHDGYKKNNRSPWKKPTEIKLDDQGGAKADGDLDYKDYRRAKWYVVNLPHDGDLEVDLDVTPPSDDKFDLAIELLDGTNFNVLAKGDKDDDDANETKKTKTLTALKPGAYLIHLYLEGRLDTCEYEVSLKYKAAQQTAAIDPNDDFPAEVQFPPAFPVVPLQDDTPVQKDPGGGGHGGGGHGGGGHGGGGHGGGGTPTPDPKTTQPVTTGGAPVSGRIINVGVNGTDTIITINIGTASNLKDGSHGSVDGVANGSFETYGCGEHSCRGKVKATVDQVQASGKVTVSP